MKVLNIIAKTFRAGFASPANPVRNIRLRAALGRLLLHGGAQEPPPRHRLGVLPRNTGGDDWTMTANATGRASNLELLRILGILMIVMMHFCGQGGFPVVHNPAVAFLASAGRLSVNIFLPDRQLAHLARAPLSQLASRTMAHPQARPHRLNGH